MLLQPPIRTVDEQAAAHAAALESAEKAIRSKVESPALDNTLPEECDDAECRRELMEEFAAQVDGCLAELREMLLSKNTAYGNSALDPVQIFSKASPGEQILVRIDDKLSRIKSGLPDQEDSKWDIMGYLVLDRIRKKHYSV